MRSKALEIKQKKPQWTLHQIAIKKLARGNARDYISFIAVTSNILVQLVWKGSDDLELEVFEPGGESLSRFTLKQAFCDENKNTVGRGICRGQH